MKTPHVEPAQNPMSEQQQPVEIGPYRFVRHPGYTATMLGGLSGSLALGSWIGFIPIAATAILFVRRTILEDNLLRKELAGYAE